MNKENAIKIGGSIITSFINLHYLEEVSRLGIIKQSAKKNLSRTLNDLKVIERDYFNETEKFDEKGIGDKLTANSITFVDWLLNEFDFNEFSEFQEIAYAYKLDAKRIKGISDKILIENGAKK